MSVIVHNASLPRGHASIRIQQYVGIITCMGLVLLRANEMDREDCTCGEESSSCESQCHIIWCVPYTVYQCVCDRMKIMSLMRLSLLRETPPPPPPPPLLSMGEVEMGMKVATATKEKFEEYDREHKRALIRLKQWKAFNFNPA